jgi:hypothetical protein
MILLACKALVYLYHLFTFVLCVMSTSYYLVNVVHKLHLAKRMTFQNKCSSCMQAVYLTGIAPIGHKSLWPRATGLSL